jgi:hypothetical protein
MPRLTACLEARGQHERTSSVGRPLRVATAPLASGCFKRVPSSGPELVIGHWGLTLDGSEPLRPIDKRTGRPMSTKNARWGGSEPEAWTFKPAGRRGQRCIPVEDFDEPYWALTRTSGGVFAAPTPSRSRWPACGTSGRTPKRAR